MTFEFVFLFFPEVKGIQTVKKMSTDKDLPIGVILVQKATKKCCHNRNWNRNFWHRLIVLSITFLSYMSYHLTRKPISVVKNVLHQNCSDVTPDPNHHINESDTKWCDWAPFGKLFHLHF